ncbi:MAG: Cys-tRNA(Pro) deacylase [Planctomycetaceae bacterium]|nr:Cys-tRNA(Pro) deacylase [Planctomycetaceae bacterium]
MSKPKQNHPTTNAIRALKQAGVAFEVIPYKYEEHGGTRHSAEQLGVDEHCMIKTLIMENEAREPMIVLMHGDREVSTKNLARFLGTKSVRPCDPEVANKHSGYFVGGTSPLGTRRKMPVYAEATIFDLPEIHINAGHRGLMLRLDPKDLHEALEITPVDVAIA